MSSPQRDRPGTGSLPWYFTKDLAALGVVSFVAITGIIVLSILAAPASPRRERQVTLQSAPTQPPATSISPGVTVPPDAAPRSPVVAPAAEKATIGARVLGTGGGSGSVTGLSAEGVAVGTITVDGALRAVRWNIAGDAGSKPVSPQDLPGSLTTPGAPGVMPSISADGVIAFTALSGGRSRPAALVGAARHTPGPVRSGRIVSGNTEGQVLVTQTGATAAEGVPAGGPVFVWTPATDTLQPVGKAGSMITDDGSVLVVSRGPGTRRTPFIWHDHTLTQLAQPAGGWSAKVAGGSGLACMVGQLVPEPGTGTARAADWRDGQVQLLPGLGGPAAIARAVNAAGVIVGAAEIPAGHAHAMRWTKGTGQDLGTLGGTTSWALDVSDGGVVAGWATTTGGVQHAAAWLPDGRVVDLGGALGPGVTSRATGITENRIYGTRAGPGNTITPVVWTLTVPPS